MANNQIPERLINFNIYKDGIRGVLGVADVELPSLEAMTDTLTGAGIAGEIDTPTIGNFGSMTMTVNFRTATPDALLLASMRQAHNLTARGAIQVQDAVTGETKVVPLVVSMRVKTKVFNPGSLEPGAAMETSFEGEVLSIRIRLNNVEYIELDKLNYVYKGGGVDETKAVRDAI